MNTAWRSLRFAPAALWAGAIWFASSFDWRLVHFPGDSRPGAGFAELLAMLVDALPAWVAVDKAVHTTIFAVLATLLRWPSRVQSLAKAAVVASSLATAWGALDEIHQAFVPGRSADWLDLVADAVGASVAVAAISLWSVGRHGRGINVVVQANPR